VKYKIKLDYRDGRLYVYGLENVPDEVLQHFLEEIELEMKKRDITREYIEMVNAEDEGVRCYTLSDIIEMFEMEEKWKKKVENGQKVWANKLRDAMKG